MSCNPMAGSLKHFRQRIVPDKRIKTTPFRVEDYLDSPEMIAAYTEALAEDDEGLGG
jgi:hypothetical protein